MTSSSGDDEPIQLKLRLHIFHLLQTVSMHTIDLDTGVPARGLHGEAYRGHIFWDELFIFPFLNLRIPEITRALLRYRYRRLPEARRAARRAGYNGAMFPWQSGSDGREETQVIHLNPRSHRWHPDHTHLQRHINVAIVFNVWQYHEATADREFISFYGAEVVLEIARFLASLTTYNAELDRYEICGVVGPDEYHDAYPDAEVAGLRNNTYTNVMTAWVLWRALTLLDYLSEDRSRELREIVGLSDEEIARWDTISRKMRIVFHDDGIISQFEGYERLQEFDWGSLSQAIRRNPQDRPDSRSRKRQPEPVQGFQAGRRAHALLPLFSRGASGAVLKARLSLRARHDSEQHRVLPSADVRWINAQWGSPGLAALTLGPHPVVGAL